MTTTEQHGNHGNGGVLYEEPVCSFGVLADVQYADVEDGMSYDKTRQRWYRTSIERLQNAVTHISQNRSESNQGAKFILQLGDLIDGKSKRIGKTQEALDKIEGIFQTFTNPIYHIIGNHELYNFTRKQLKTTYISHDQVPDYVFYHQVAVCPGYRLVVLDCYDVAVMGYGDEAEETRAAARFLRERNPNLDWNSSDDLPPGGRHYTGYNGGIGEQQLMWLEGVLQESEKQGEKVILAGHIPLYTDSPYFTNLVWNHGDVLSVVQKYKCVVVYFTGHEHDGGYYSDTAGVHHVTVQAILETPPGEYAHGLVYLYHDRLVLEGQGRVPSRVLYYRK